MATMVIARVFLYVKSSDPDVLAELDKRYPREAEANLSQLVFPEDGLGTNLDSALNGEILAKIREYDREDATSCSAFSEFDDTSIWEVGSSGQHDPIDRSIFIDPEVEFPTWYFEVDGTRHSILAGAVWDVVEVPE